MKQIIEQFKEKLDKVTLEHRSNQLIKRSDVESLIQQSFDL